MSVAQLYELTEPTEWAAVPTLFSYSSLKAMRECPRRWQLVHSRWGEHPRFPERPQPAAIEGQIIHEALELLVRAVGRAGRPPFGSSAFGEAVERSGFWEHFPSKVQEWNRKLAAHPRGGPAYVLRRLPADLANQAVCLFREQYRPGFEGVAAARTVPSQDGAGGTSLGRLRARGVLAEEKLQHPVLPFMGVLDLVVAEGDHVVVIDFKTGSPMDEHREQLLLYALLWWRVTGERPVRAVAQYLGTSVEVTPAERELLAAEEALGRDIKRARTALAAHPAPPRTGPHCSWCPVRARCDEGWAACEGSAPAGSGKKTVDLEVSLLSPPGPTGFLAMRRNGGEVSVVYGAAVGSGVPQASADQRLRLIDAAARGTGREVEVLPWTEIYRL